MVANLFSIIGLYFAMVYYVVTGAVDPGIFSNVIPDILRNIIVMF